MKSSYYLLLVSYLSLGFICTSCVPTSNRDENGGKGKKGDMDAELIEALTTNNVNAIKSLAAKGVNLNVPLIGIGVPPIHCIIAEMTTPNNRKCIYSKDMLDALIKQGAKIDMKVTDDNKLFVDEAPINYAVNTLRLAVFNDLLNAGADPNIGTQETPLHAAIIIYGEQSGDNEKSALDMINTLINAKAIDRKKPDHLGKEPLYYAYYDESNKLYSDEKMKKMAKVIELFKDKGIRLPGAPKTKDQIAEIKAKVIRNGVFSQSIDDYKDIIDQVKVINGPDDLERYIINSPMRKYKGIQDNLCHGLIYYNLNNEIIGTDKEVMIDSIMSMADYNKYCLPEAVQNNKIGDVAKAINEFNKTHADVVGAGIRDLLKEKRLEKFYSNKYVDFISGDFGFDTRTTSATKDEGAMIRLLAAYYRYAFMDALKELGIIKNWQNKVGHPESFDIEI